MAWRRTNNKYSNKKVKLDGIVFDSIREAQRYKELKLLERAGEITDLELQKPFELVPAQYEYYERYGKNNRRLKDGKRTIEQSVVYKADFVYKVPITMEKLYSTEDGKIESMQVYCGFETVVEDTKGMKTKEYIIKRKLMLHVHGIRIREV